MQTATNVVLSYIRFYITLFFICSLTILDDSFRVSILVNIFYKVTVNYYWDPKTPDMPDISPLNFYFRVNILLRPFSNIFGKFKNLNVCPVGAVSNTMTSKSIF